MLGIDSAEPCFGLRRRKSEYQLWLHVARPRAPQFPPKLIRYVLSGDRESVEEKLGLPGHPDPQIIVDMAAGFSVHLARERRTPGTGTIAAVALVHICRLREHSDGIVTPAYSSRREVAVRDLWVPRTTTVRGVELQAPVEFDDKDNLGYFPLRVGRQPEDVAMRPIITLPLTQAEEDQTTRRIAVPIGIAGGLQAAVFGLQHLVSEGDRMVAVERVYRPE